MADDYPLSWYAATVDAAPLRVPLDRLIEADVAVIGGGFAGLHTARLLAKRGKRVVLIERHRVGWGASGRNGGFVSPGWAARSAAIVKRLGAGPARELYALSKRGVAIVEEAIAEVGRPELVMGRRKLLVSRIDQGPDFADRTRRLAESLGASFEPWPAERVREVVRTGRYHQGVHEPNCFHTHPLNLALALAADIEARGGQVFEGTDAVSLEKNGGSWRVGTKLSGAGVRCRDVVLAGNADLGPVAPALAAAVLPVATYVVVTEKLGRRIQDLMPWKGALSDTRRAGDYYRIVDGDRLLWGGRITTRQSVPPRLAAMMRSDIADVFPSLGEVRIEYAWAGSTGLCGPQDAPRRRGGAPSVDLLGIRRPWCGADGRRRRCGRLRHRGRGRSLAAVRSLPHRLGGRLARPGRRSSRLLVDAGTRPSRRTPPDTQRRTVAQLSQKQSVAARQRMCPDG